VFPDLDFEIEQMMEGLTTEETMKKKETRKVMVRLTQEQIDLALTAPISTARMPMCTEEQLASVKNKDLRDRIRESLANAAESCTSRASPSRL
jgi:hypothetical protein